MSLLTYDLLCVCALSPLILTNKVCFSLTVVAVVCAVLYRVIGIFEMNSSPPSYEAATNLPPYQVLVTATSEKTGNNLQVHSTPQNTQLYNTQNYYPVIIPNAQTDLGMQQERNKRRKRICMSLTFVFWIVVILKIALYAFLRQSARIN